MQENLIDGSTGARSRHFHLYKLTHQQLFSTLSAFQIIACLVRLSLGQLKASHGYPRKLGALTLPCPDNPFVVQTMAGLDVCCLAHLIRIVYDYLDFCAFLHWLELCSLHACTWRLAPQTCYTGIRTITVLSLASSYCPVKLLEVFLEHTQYQP